MIAIQDRLQLRTERRMSIYAPSTVRLTYGIHSIFAEIAGLTVAEAQLAYKEILSVSDDAEAYVNGQRVEKSRTLHHGDRLELMKVAGRKGQDFWSKTEFLELTGLSEAQWIKLRRKGLQTCPVGDEELIENQEFKKWIQQLIYGDDFERVEQLVVSQTQMLKTAEVAKILDCSYNQAREKMLSGQIRTVKEGRWLRSRRDWVEEYIERNSIYVDPEKIHIPIVAGKKKKAATVKPGSIAIDFLRELRD